MSERRAKWRYKLLACAALVVLGVVTFVIWKNWKPPEFRQLLQKAKAGDETSQYSLGKIYEKGAKGVPRNPSAAIAWYTKAAAQGNTKAETRLSWMYAKGDGVAKDPQAAFQWVEKAAKANDAVAQRVLGEMYRNGQGVPQNEKIAVEWSRKAAQQGEGGAQAIIGLEYVLGRGVARDRTIGCAWLLLAQANNIDKVAEKVTEAVKRVESKMSPSEIAEAQRLATQWWEAKPAGSFKMREHSEQAIPTHPKGGTAPRSQNSHASPVYTPPPQASPRLSRSDGCQSGHWIESVTDDGEIVKLEDGSVWQVQSGDSVDSMLWLPTDSVTVCHGLLINTDESEKVEAARIH